MLRQHMQQKKPYGSVGFSVNNSNLLKLQLLCSAIANRQSHWHTMDIIMHAQNISTYATILFVTLSKPAPLNLSIAQPIT